MTSSTLMELHLCLLQRHAPEMNTEQTLRILRYARIQ
jgi:hypothetical protein